MIDPFEIYQKIHFIGIGGIGISALARLLKQKGHQITGSDQTRTHNSDLLITEGIDIVFEHTIASLPKDAQLIIHTTAIPSENPELVEGQKRGLPVLSYPQAVGKLTKNMNTLSVCGTHGKTTITAMLGHALIGLGIDPTVIVGSLVKDFNNSNLAIGKSNLLILESCEYHEAFLNYFPKVVLLNNIDPEHLDFFHTAENYLNAFRKFLKNLPENGTLIANGDDKNIKKLLIEQPSKVKILTFGREKENDYQLTKNTVKLPNGTQLTLDLHISGDHNLLNATACLAAFQALKIDPTITLPFLAQFTGAARRLELKGKIRNIPVIDDYGHAPAEIRATLQALKSQYGNNSKILCVFQPHQYSRTYYFLKEFSQSFADATTVLIPNIYRSRDTAQDLQKINVDQLVEAINAQKPNTAFNTLNFPNTIKQVKNHLPNIDIVLTIGAGDITRLADDILRELS